MKSQMTMGKKLMSAFGGIILLVLGLGFVSFTSVGNLGTSLEEAVNVTAKKLDLVNGLRARV